MESVPANSRTLLLSHGWHVAASPPSPTRAAQRGSLTFFTSCPAAVVTWFVGIGTLQHVLRRRAQRTAAGAEWKQKHLAIELSGLPSHPSKNVKLEQYATDGDIAARWLLGINAQDPFANMEQGIVDLGAGNGILGIGALLLGAPRAVFVEVDPAAADAIEEGLEAQSLSARSRVLRCDVEEVVDDPDCVCDLVLMNPPWGQQRKSADRPFLQASIALAKTSVHMMHSAGAMHVEPWARDHGWRAVKWLDVEFPLPRKYAHQSRRRGFTSAAMWRICPEISMSKTESKSRRVLSDDLF